jgi:hypothetical protein
MAVDSNTGVVIRVNKPEHTVVTFFELVGRESYEQAYNLLTVSSRLRLMPEDFSDSFRITGAHEARLVEVIPGPETENIAIVAHTRLNKLRGSGEFALFAVEVLRKRTTADIWEISRDFGEFSEAERQWLLPVLVSFEEELLERDDVFQSINAERRSEIEKQLQALLARHRASLEKIEAGEAEAPKTDEQEAADVGSEEK